MSRPEKVFIGIISHDRRIDADTAMGLVDVLDQSPMTVGSVRFGMQQGQSAARNLLVNEFLATDCDSLLFVDTDMAFRWPHLKRLLSCPEGIVCGRYSHKKPGMHWALNITPGQEPREVDGFIECQEAPTGFMLVRRRVFEAMIASGNIPRVPRDGDGKPVYVFYRFECYKGRDLTEDWSFCVRAEEAGFRPWVDNTLYIPHIGPALWPLQLCYPEIFAQ